MFETERYYSGTAARDLDHLLALPEIDLDQWQDEPLREEKRETQVRRQPKKQVQTAKKQSVTGFAILGAMGITMLLLLVVLSHVQLAVLSSEVMQLEQSLNTLSAEATRLQGAHDLAFHTTQVERFAREELGMVDAVRGQVIFLESSTIDTARVIVPVEESSQGLFRHLIGLLQAYIPFLG